jgi:hypothetical protein
VVFGKNPDFGTPRFPENPDFFYRKCHFRQIWEIGVFWHFGSRVLEVFDTQKPEIWGSGVTILTILDHFGTQKCQFRSDFRHFIAQWAIAILWLPDFQEIPKKTPPKKLHQKIHLLKAPPRNLGMDQYQEIGISGPRARARDPRVVG